MVSEAKRPSPAIALLGGALLAGGLMITLYAIVRPTTTPQGTQRAMLYETIGIAKEAGQVAMRHYENVGTDALEVETKADDSPVTKADKEINALIIERLAKLTPDAPVIAEESDLPPYEVRRFWPRFWLVDPIDGTKEFLKKNGEFSINIALVEGDEPVIGVIYAPATDVLYYAAKTEGAWKKVGTGEPQRIHSEAPAKDAPLRVLVSRSHAEGLDLGEVLPGRTVQERIPSGSAIKFGLLAEGVGDVYVRTSGTMEWDVAAGDCIYRHSGRGAPRTTPFTYNKPDVSNPGFVVGLEP